MHIHSFATLFPIACDKSSPCSWRIKTLCRGWRKWITQQICHRLNRRTLRRQSLSSMIPEMEGTRGWEMYREESLSALRDKLWKWIELFAQEYYNVTCRSIRREFFFLENVAPMERKGGLVRVLYGRNPVTETVWWNCLTRQPWTPWIYAMDM